jgi:hypothetical protein
VCEPLVLYHLLKDFTVDVTYPYAMIIDVTSKAQDEFVKFSPFYPIGGIPVPFTEDLVALSVEGIWQGLKVFEDNDIDTSLFSKRDMKNMKRTKRKFGRCLGHRKGVHGEELLGYLTDISAPLQVGAGE